MGDKLIIYFSCCLVGQGLLKIKKEKKLERRRTQTNEPIWHKHTVLIGLPLKPYFGGWASISKKKKRVIIYFLRILTTK